MNEKLDSKTLPVDVLAVMESVWHQGLDETNVRDFEKARAAVAELIEADVAQDDRIEELEEALAARQPVGELHLPPDGFYKIVYDDAQVPDESFARTGALDAALRRFEQISARWNAHLFVRFANNTRDCTVPNATPAQAVDLKGARDSIQALLNWIDDWAETPEESGLDPIADRALEVVAQIDAQVYAHEPNTNPAQAVDMGAVRALLQRRIEQWRSHLPADPGAPGTREIEAKGESDYNNDVRIYREGIAVMEEVLSLTDSQAVGNG